MSNTASLMMKGQCMCGVVAYQINSMPFDGCYCFCSICRKLTGSTFGAYGTVPLTDFLWVTGESTLKTFKQNGNLTRIFCAQCGSFMAGTHELDPDNIFLSLGCLQGADEVKIDYQQFVASKATWAKVNPAITAHDAWPDWVIEKVKRLRNHE